MARLTLIPVTYFLRDILPPDLLGDASNTLQFIRIAHLSADAQASAISENIDDVSSFRWDEDGFYLQERFAIVADNEPEFDFPLIPGSRLRVGRPGIQYPLFTTEIRTENGFSIKIKDLSVTLHIPPSILRTCETDQSVGWKENPEDYGYDITWTSDFEISEEKGFVFGGSVRNLKPFMVGTTGVIVDLSNTEVTIITEEVPVELVEYLPPDFKGFYLSEASVVYFKPGSKFDPKFTVRNLGIGSGGFSGELYFGNAPDRDGDPAGFNAETLEGLFVESEPSNNASPEERENGFERPDEEGNTRHVYPAKFQDMKAVLEYFGMGMRQNIPEWGVIKGYVFIPFAQKWVSLRASIGGANGDFMLEIGGVGNEGLISLETDIFKVTADSIAYQLEDKVNYAVIAGSIRLKKPEGLNLPDFRVQKLKIGSNGDVKIEGGWLRAPEQVNIDLGGFKIGIKEIGFGNDGENEAKRQWVGFSGEVQLIEALPIKGAVDGLKISWLHDDAIKLHKTNNPNSPAIDPLSTIHIELRGIKVAFKIPGVMEFDGHVDYDRATNLFKGHIKINLISLRCEVEGSLLVGKYRDSEGREFGVFYIHLGAKLPTPIVLGSTGMGLSAIEGLVGINVAPNKPAVAAPAPAPTTGSNTSSGNTSTNTNSTPAPSSQAQGWHSWYREKAPAYNITHVDKWAPMNDNYAFGAGIKIGTLHDGGTSLNISALLAVLIPGPVIMLQGKVNLLKPRSDDKKEEGAFNVFAVLDCRASTFQLNIDVRYSLEDIVSISGGLEAFFNFNNSEDWHIWVGQKTPESKRIRADVLKIFSANTYFMIDPRALQLGASVGFNFSETYGPAAVRLVARFSFDAAIFFKPFQLEGSMELVADLGVTVFGIGLRLLLEAMLGAKTPKPFEIYGKAKVKLQLFWPIPEVGFEVEFKWITPAATYPTWPLLKELAESMANPTLLPLAFMQHHKSTSFEARMFKGSENDQNNTSIPYVPIDSRPRLTFAKGLHFIGNQQLNDKPDQVGSGRFWYHLNNLVLEEWNNTGWATVMTGINVPFAQREPNTRCFQLNISTSPQTGDTHFLNDNTAKEPIIELWKYGVWDTLGSHNAETAPTTDPACGRILAFPQSHEINWLQRERRRNLPLEFWKDGVLFVVDPLYSASSPFLLNVSSSITEPYIGLEGKMIMLKTRGTTMHFPQRVFEATIHVYYAIAELNEIFPNSNQDAPPAAERIFAALAQFKVSGISNGELVANGELEMDNHSLIVKYVIRKNTGFNSIRLDDYTSSNNAFWLHSIVYKTYDRPINPYLYPMNVEGAAPTHSRINAQSSETILKPASTYRLTVKTIVTSNPNKESIVNKNADERAEATDYFYFKTDNGPGFPTKPNTATTERLPYAPEAPVQTSATAPTLEQRDPTQPSAMPDPNAPDAPKTSPNPVNLLSSYVLATYPTHGATVHYRKSPIIIAFNEAYLISMWKGRQLELRLKDRNNQNRKTIVIDLRDVEAELLLSGMPLLNRGLMAWVAALRNGGCSNNHSPVASMAPVLSFPVIDPELAEHTLYFAELWSDAPGLQEKVKLYDFQFTTSRYADFAAHIKALDLSDSENSDQKGFAKARSVGSVNIQMNQFNFAEPISFKTLYRDLMTEYKGKVSDQTQTYPHEHLVSIYDAMLKAKIDYAQSASRTFDLLYKSLEDEAFQIMVPGSTQKVDMRNRGLPEKPEIIQIPLQNTQNSLLLFESPEPLDWANITGTIQLGGTSVPFNAVPNTDQTRAFLVRNNELAFGDGTFTFELTFDPFTEYSNKLDIGRTGEVAPKVTFKLALTGNYTQIVAGLRMEAGQEISSPNGATKLLYLPNGNLNLVFRNTLLWSSRTEGQTPGRVEMQTDGNLVMYTPQHVAVWASGTWGNAYAGSVLRLYNNGQLSVFSASQNRNVWTTGIVEGGIPKDGLQPGESLLPDQSLYSNNRQFRFIYQPNGNLVLYRTNDGAALWASGTHGQPTGRFEMKADGILAIYGPNNAIQWAVRYASAQALVGRLQLSDTGAVNILAADGTVINSIEHLEFVSPQPENFIAFRHLVTAGNVLNSMPSITILDHPQLNGNPGAVLFVNPVWSDASGGVENPHAFGVWYREERWVIFNQNPATPMLMGASFLVMATSEENPHVFVHTAMAASLSMDRTYVDHPASNNRPDALLMVTQRFGEYNNREIGVTYSPNHGQWIIFNKIEVGGDPYDEALHGIPLYAKFNVLVVDGNNVPGINAFKHRALADNIIPPGQHITFINHASINGKADAHLFFTESWLNTGGVGNRSVSALWYDDPGDQVHNRDGYWSLNNLSDHPMEQGRMFNVFVLEEQAGLLSIPPPPVLDERFTFVAYRHRVGTTFNANVNASTLDHPLLNNNPNAMIFANSNYGSRNEGLDNGNLFGVRYNGTNWEIASQSGQPNTMNPAYWFNILIAPQRCPNAFVHVATRDSLQSNRTFLDHPLLNGRPDVHLMVTQNLTNGQGNNHEIGVAYTNERWFIFNQVSPIDGVYNEANHGIPEGARFNILVLSGAEQSNIEVLAHQAAGKNINRNVSFMSHPKLDHNREAMVFATQAWLPVLGGHNNPSMIALWYDDVAANGGKYKGGFWSVYNSVPGISMEYGVVFNVFVVT